MQHVRIFYIAREVSLAQHQLASPSRCRPPTPTLTHKQPLAFQFLQKHHGYQIVGGLMSPKHDSEVRRTVRTQTTYSIPSRHRVGMCEAAVDSSSWLAVDRWAVTRKLVMDYPSVLGNVKQVQRYYYTQHCGSLGPLGAGLSHTYPMHCVQVLTKAFPKETPAVIYLCGADDLVRSIGRMRMTCVCVARPGYMDELRRAVGKKHRALVSPFYPTCHETLTCQADLSRCLWDEILQVHVVDDDSVLTTVVDSLSSTKVRRRFGQGKPVDDMVGADVVAYLNK